MTPPPDMARRVLEKVQWISKRFGTNIAIENGVGVIRMSAQTTTSQGAKQEIVSLAVSANVGESPVLAARFTSGFARRGECVCTQQSFAF